MEQNHSWRLYYCTHSSSLSKPGAYVTHNATCWSGDCGVWCSAVLIMWPGVWSRDMRTPDLFQFKMWSHNRRRLRWHRSRRCVRFGTGKTRSFPTLTAAAPVTCKPTFIRIAFLHSSVKEVRGTRPPPRLLLRVQLMLVGPEHQTLEHPQHRLKCIWHICNWPLIHQTSLPRPSAGGSGVHRLFLRSLRPSPVSSIS